MRNLNLILRASSSCLFLAVASGCLQGAQAAFEHEAPDVEIFTDRPSAARSAWAAAQRDYTVAGYSVFLETHPDDPKRREAETHRAVLQKLAASEQKVLSPSRSRGYFSLVPVTIVEMGADSLTLTAVGPYQYGSLRVPEGTRAALQMKGTYVTPSTDPPRPGSTATLVVCGEHSSGFSVELWTPMHVWLCPGSPRPAPVHAAAAAGDGAAVVAALDAGAAPDERDLLGRTPLVCAVEAGSLEVARLLLDRGASPDARSLDGRAALHRASSPESLELALLLLDRGASADAAGLDRVSAVHAAAEAGNPTLLRRLIEGRARADQGRFDEARPIHLAAAHGHLEVVRILLASGVAADPGTRGLMTPLELARRNGHAEVVALLDGAAATPR